MSVELLIPEVIINKLDLPDDWSYEKSVKKVKGSIYKAKTLTQNILKELSVAREILNKNFKAYQKRGEANVPPPPTWDQYCQDIGVEKRRINQ